MQQAKRAPCKLALVEQLADILKQSKCDTSSIPVSVRVLGRLERLVSKKMVEEAIKN
jgi:hypothetical protein